MDEHSPYWTPEAPITWRSFFAGIGRAVLLVVAVAMVVSLLPGCEDLDRRLAEQEYRAKVFNACLPEEGQRIVVVRDEDSIHFTRIDVGPGRYGRKFPHTEVRVSTIEGI